MSELRFCAVPDRVGTLESRWPDGNITWTLTDSVPGIPDADLISIIQAQLAKWAAVCGIVPKYTDTARTARILVTHRSIDGPSNVLAETELPNGSAQVHLWFDSEKWSEGDNPVASTISINIVGLHELGHALGLGHCTTGETAVMNPVYNPRVSTPQPWDVQQVQARYGKPVQQPTPNPTPSPGGNAMQNFLMQMVMNFVKQWLTQAIADGTLTKILTDLLNKLGTGQIVTAEQLVAEVQNHAQALTQP